MNLTCPTDPVAANSIVQGRFADKYIPQHVRLIISAESGANDGLGFPFLFLAMYLMKYSTTAAITNWLLRICLYQVLLSVVLGIAIGVIARIALQFADQRKLIDTVNVLSFSISLSFFMMGIIGLLGSDDLLAIFIAGNVISWDGWINTIYENSMIQEVLDSLFNLTYFVFFGSIIPWGSFGTENLETWKLLLLGAGVLLLRRLPIVMALHGRFIPTLKTPREAAFSGFFGPIGVGAIFYATIALKSIEAEEVNDGGKQFETLQRILFPVVCFLVLASVIIHGITVPLFHFSVETQKKLRAGSRMNVRRQDVATARSIDKVEGPLVFEEIELISES